MYMDIEKLYADIELDGEDFFVITPEGNYYHFHQILILFQKYRYLCFLRR